MDIKYKMIIMILVLTTPLFIITYETGDTLNCKLDPTDYSKSEFGKQGMKIEEATKLCESWKTQIKYGSFIFLVLTIIVMATIKLTIRKWNKGSKEAMQRQHGKCYRCQSTLIEDETWYGGNDEFAYCDRCAIALGFDKELEDYMNGKKKEKDNHE